MQAPAKAPAPGPGSQKRFPGSACQDPSARALLMRYAQSDCEEDEALDVEVHLLLCATCFADLKRLDRASRLVMDLRALTLPSPGTAPDAIPKARAS